MIGGLRISPDKDNIVAAQALAPDSFLISRSTVSFMMFTRYRLYLQVKYDESRSTVPPEGVRCMPVLNS